MRSQTKRYMYGPQQKKEEKQGDQDKRQTLSPSEFDGDDYVGVENGEVTKNENKKEKKALFRFFPANKHAGKENSVKEQEEESYKGGEERQTTFDFKDDLREDSKEDLVGEVEEQVTEVPEDQYHNNNYGHDGL
eukprot:TRINITY_DN3546_c0_g1_i12.p2 TRINITY_DN3546_c0_g1~~TRINITY_DN3546_c0_g1_i12.p2  ORF type:complete len:134 (-),score=60.06 TRINITY_DN3546_c0_g1_i12:91-492(-)